MKRSVEGSRIRKESVRQMSGVQRPTRDKIVKVGNSVVHDQFINTNVTRFNQKVPADSSMPSFEKGGRSKMEMSRSKMKIKNKHIQKTAVHAAVG